MKTLFDQTTLGNLKLKNRLWRSATWMNLADEKGHITSALQDHYIKLAQGGVGSIITGYAFVLEEEQPNHGMIGIYNDSFISEYQKLNEILHSCDCHSFLQIVYGGSFSRFNTGKRTIWGPSAVAHPLMGTVPTAMNIEEIKLVTRAFAEAALRAQKAGFSGVQIHGAHSYLLSQFLSPYYNRRFDDYGGSIHNRGRIIYEILEAIRMKVGSDYPVLIKMHATDDWDGQGLELKESLEVIQVLEQNGITAVELSGGTFDRNYPNRGPGRVGIIPLEKQSYFLEDSQYIAAKLNVPIISVGGHRNPDYMEEALNSSRIEYFALSRPLLSEPDLPIKWKAGKREALRCVSCGRCWSKDGNYCIFDRQLIENNCQ